MREWGREGKGRVGLWWWWVVECPTHHTFCRACLLHTHILLFSLLSPHTHTHTNPHPHLPPLPVPSLSLPRPRCRSNGTLEFSIKGKNTDAFFPVRVNFASAETLCPIRVASIIPVDGAPGDKPLRYSVATSLTVEEYVIE